MKTNLILSFLFLITALNFNAQSDSTDSFIPKGYVEYEKHFSDLNKDGKEDCILIIKKQDTNNVVINRFNEKVDRNRRGIIVLFKQENGYQLADTNYRCFSSENEDGGIYFPPQLTIEFKRGNLQLHYGHGRYGFWTYTFRYQKGSFKLIGYDSSNNYGPVINEEISINFLTKKKLTRTNTNENAEGSDEVFTETWSNIKIDNLIELSQIKDFDELEMYKY